VGYNGSEGSSVQQAVSASFFSSMALPTRLWQRVGLGREERKHGVEPLSHGSQPGLNLFVEGASAAS
jgi:hypothetical protein